MPQQLVTLVRTTEKTAKSGKTYYRCCLEMPNREELWVTAWDAPPYPAGTVGVANISGPDARGGFLLHTFEPAGGTQPPAQVGTFQHAGAVAQNVAPQPPRVDPSCVTGVVKSAIEAGVITRWDDLYKWAHHARCALAGDRAPEAEPAAPAPAAAPPAPEAPPLTPATPGSADPFDDDIPF